MQSEGGPQGVNAESVISNNEITNNEIISMIEKELHDNSNDLISLVFLLYEVPDTALQRLIVFQSISNDASCMTNLNMLHDWFIHAKKNSTWKHEFVEALLICQLYSIVRKLGFNISSARKYYQTDNISVKMYINPMKKALYKLCENINEDNLLKLKKALLTYNIDTTEYENCEMIFLKLMCEKFITVNQYQYNKKGGCKVDMGELFKIVEKLPGLRKIVLEMTMLQESINVELNPIIPVNTSTPSAPLKLDEITLKQDEENYYNGDFDDVMDMLAKLHIDDIPQENFKSDRKLLGNDSYEIKSSKRVGVCVIINQENFYPSKSSIELFGQNTSLDKRVGSEKDQLELEKTMKSLKFSVYSAKDLDHKEMIEFILRVIKEEVNDEDSIFMLCILSHGVKGHVYAADSIKVKMDDIQNVLDSYEAAKIHDKPKLLIVQACQVDETDKQTLVADSPNSHSKKSNFLIYYSTSPDLEAYRNEKKGSIFIQILCRTIKKYACTEHVYDIFTKVNDGVIYICNKVGYLQVPLFQSSLRKKLYLQVPQNI